MKKKILLLSTFIIVAIVVLCNFDKKEVKAEGENCQIYYNYYLFLDSSRKDSLTSYIEPANRTTEKNFKLGIPENATYVDSGKVEIDISDNLTTNLCEAKKWNLKQFYDKFISFGSGEAQYSSSFVQENGIDGVCSYAKAIEWVDENNNKQFGLSDGTKNYSVFKSLVPSGYGHPIINLKTGSRGIGIKGENKESSFTINRRYAEGDLDSYANDDIVRSPAVYYESYKLCEEATPTYTLTVEHFLDDTTKKLKDDYVKSGYKTGQEDSYDCPAIDGYTVVNSSNKPNKHTVKFENENITKQCYYKENTYLLTINFGDDETCKNKIAKSVTYDGLKAGQVQTHTIEKTIGQLNNPKLGDFSKAFKTDPTLKDLKLSATMPAKNVDICIAYSPQTGASWIYLVWVIGGLALGYSVWYFVRYYKKQNSEI